MIKLDYYNKLPARDEHLALVLSKLLAGRRLQIKNLVMKTSLTRTQVLCALQALLDKGAITYELEGKTKYFLIDN